MANPLTPDRGSDVVPTPQKRLSRVMETIADMRLVTPQRMQEVITGEPHAATNDDIMLMRASVHAINGSAAEKSGEKVKAEIRETVTPNIRMLYIPAALEALVDLRRKSLGTASQRDFDLDKLASWEGRLSRALEKLQGKIQTFFTPLRFGNANILTKSWEPLVAEAMNGTRMRTSPVDSMKKEVEETEKQRWLALQKFVGGRGIKTAPALRAEYEALMDAYVEVVQEVEKINDGKYVMDKAGQTALATEGLKAQEPGANRVAGKIDLGDTLAKVKEAVETSGNKAYWANLLQAGRVFLGTKERAYTFNISDGGITVDPPLDRKKNPITVAPEALQGVLQLLGVMGVDKNHLFGTQAFTMDEDMCVLIEEKAECKEKKK